VEPFATILIAHAMFYISVPLHKAKRARPQLLETHQCHNHKDHDACLLNRKSILHWTSLGQFWM